MLSRVQLTGKGGNLEVSVYAICAHCPGFRLWTMAAYMRKGGSWYVQYWLNFSCVPASVTWCLSITYCHAILLRLLDRVYPTCRTCARDRGLKTMANGQGRKLMDCHALLLPCVAQPWYDGTLPHSNQCNQCAFGGFVDNGRWPEGGSWCSVTLSTLQAGPLSRCIKTI